jgi:hypothetical protein
MIVFRKSKLFADNDVNNEKKNDNSGLVLGLGLAGSGVLGVGSVIGANRYINNGKVRIQEEYNKNIEDLINRDKKQAEDFKRLEKDIVDNYNDKKKKLNGLINDNEYLIDSATDKKTKKELYETENYYYNRLKDEKKEYQNALEDIEYNKANWKEDYKIYEDRYKKQFEDDTKKFMKDGLAKSRIIKGVGLGLAGVGALGSGLYYYNKKKKNN